MPPLTPHNVTLTDAESFRRDSWWPALPFAEWEPTLSTVHMLTQIVGKIKLALTPFVNEWWNVTLLVTPRGLASGSIPFGSRSFSVDFDFLAHQIVIQTTAGEIATIPLVAQPVADTYAAIVSALGSFEIVVSISTLPSEVADPIPFPDDRVHASYDRDAVQRWWRVITGTERVLQRFRTPFAGKSSPIHFFWGSFDLNHTRFSGRPATPPTTWPKFMQIAERQENFCCGFWPGNVTASGVALNEPAFFAYIFPEPPGFKDARVAPDAAEYHATLGEFLLNYDDARQSADPDATILAFLQTSYEAAATLSDWDRDSLEHHE